MPQDAQAPRRRRKNARPAEIIEAAFGVFVEHGYGGARLDEVARRAGIAKGTIYLYFDTKQELFAEVIKTRVSSVIGEVTALADGYDGASDILLQMIVARAYQDLVRSDASHLMRIIIGEGHQFPELRKLYYDLAIRRGLALMDRVIARGVARGEFREGPATEYPRLVMAPCIMAAIWSMTFDDFAPIDIDRFMAGHLDILLNGLRA